MPTISILIVLCLGTAGLLDGPPSSPEGRYRELGEAAARSRDSKAPPWRTFAEFAPRFVRIAADAPGDPASLAALLAAAEYGSACLDTCRYDGSSDSLLMGRVLGSITEAQLGDERVGRLCTTLSRLPSPAREEFLRRAASGSPARSVRGRASLALAQLLATKASCADPLAGEIPADLAAKAAETWGVDYLAQLRACDRVATRVEAEGLLERVVGEFGDVAFVRGTSETPVWRSTAEKDAAAGKTLGSAAESELEELRNLAIGCVAPEIEGRDADGTSFKLSDYRGKVVLLTFSGNWCGPCRSMYPFERELVSRLEGRPFAMLSVNTDETLATLRESIRAGEVAWRCWWAGGPAGEIPSRWNVKAWPTIYLIDARGVIRAKNPRDESLDDLIASLLREKPDNVGIPRRE